MTVRDPIDSFGPEIFNALREGTHRRISMTLPYRDAVRLRVRIHRLRAKMGEQGHQLYGLVMKAEVRIEIPPDVPIKTKQYRNARTPVDPNSLVNLVILPKDSDFKDVILKAGVSVPTITHEDLTSDTTAPTDLETLLKDLK